MHRKVYSTIMLAVFLWVISFGIINTGAYAQNSCNDIQEHWAQAQIEALIDQDIVNGYPDHSFKPDKTVNRAEFITMINQAFGFEQTAVINYSDVKDDEWFAVQIARAKAAEYISGYEDGTMRPTNEISRQEVAVIIKRIMDFNCSGNQSKLSVFRDVASIQDWSSQAVDCLLENNIIKGYPDNTFRPGGKLTRAEAAVILSRVIDSRPKTILDQAGTYGPETGINTISGDVDIVCADIVLENTTIEGNLTIAKSVGSGNVTLKNVTVKGKTYVKGGGEHSIVLINFNGAKMEINVPDGHTVRLVAKGDTIVAELTVKTSTTLEESQLKGEGFSDVILDESLPKGANIELKGDFGNVSSNAEDLNLEIGKGSQVDNLELNASAKITGKGKILTADINSDDIEMEQKPDKVKIESGLTATVAGKTVKGTSGGGGGGGGGGGSITEEQIQVTAIKVFVEGGSRDALGQTADFTEVNNNVLVTEAQVTASPSGADLVIEDIIAKGEEWLNKSVSTSLPSSGKVNTRSLLGDLDTGDVGVSLGSLRRVFGPDEIVVKGHLEKEGYRDSSQITVTIKLGPDVGEQVNSISNQWVNVVKNGTKINVSIKPGKENATLADIGEAKLLSILTGGSSWPENVTVSGKTYENISDVKLNRLLNSIKLGDLVGKDITFQLASGDPIFTVEVKKS